MSDSVQPHKRQPTRLPCPWDSPGKNTGVGCHFLLQCMKVKSESEVAQSCPTPSDPMDCEENVPYSLRRESPGAGRVYTWSGQDLASQNAIIPLMTFSLELLAVAHTAFSYIFPLRLTNISIFSSSSLKRCYSWRNCKEPRLFLLFALPPSPSCFFGPKV